MRSASLISGRLRLPFVTVAPSIPLCLAARPATAPFRGSAKAAFAESPPAAAWNRIVTGACPEAPKETTFVLRGEVPPTPAAPGWLPLGPLSQRHWPLPRLFCRGGWSLRRSSPSGSPRNGSESAARRCFLIVAGAGRTLSCTGLRPAGSSEQSGCPALRRQTRAVPPACNAQRRHRCFRPFARRISMHSWHKECILLLGETNTFPLPGRRAQPVRIAKEVRPTAANNQLGDLVPAAAMVLLWLAWVMRLLWLNLRSLRRTRRVPGERLQLSPWEHRFLADLHVRWDR